MVHAHELRAAGADAGTRWSHRKVDRATMPEYAAESSAQQSSQGAPEGKNAHPAAQGTQLSRTTICVLFAALSPQLPVAHSQYSHIAAVAARKTASAGAAAV